jgi:hypothetical protein
VSVQEVCDGDKKESLCESQAQENSCHQGGQAQKDYDCQKNQDNQKKGDEEDAPASVI